MYNDFIIVGPTNDPSGIRGLTNSSEIFNRIDKTKSAIKFVSRGDNSGTHIKELELWSNASFSINSDDVDWVYNNRWYKETGSGMGLTLTIASQLQAYTLTDRGTWLFMKENLSLELLAEGSSLWHNLYGAILVNPENFESNINFELAKKYVQWLISPFGQDMINNYKISEEQAFFANFIYHIDELTEEEKDFWGIRDSFLIQELIINGVCQRGKRNF
jgi:tungstate transport system substrate-binding protein